MTSFDLNPSLERILKRIGKLPTLPVVVSKLMKLVQDPNTSAIDINNVLTQDQSLSAKMLKLANSSFYGLRQQVTNLNHAIMVLGFNTLKSIALSASVFSSFQGEKKNQTFDREEFWFHALSCGTTCRVLAPKININPDDAFLAGLLHDIGKVIIDIHLENEFQLSLENSAKNNCYLFESEKEIIGSDHAEIGAWLVHQWQLPENLVNAIRYHHILDPKESSYPLSALIHMSNFIIKSLELGFGGDLKFPYIDPAVENLFHISNNEIDSLLTKIYEDCKNARNVLNT